MASDARGVDETGAADGADETDEVGGADGAEADEDLRVSDLVAMCLERLSAGDSDALDELCGHHPDQASALRARLARLQELGLTSTAPSGGPERIGPFHVVGSLGHGGMGEVYLGRQDAPVRRVVAVKVVSAGVQRADARARFEAERQILTQLGHPGIARVLEAGTTEDARPWFAMEYVDGAPITAWCDQHELSIDERLALFLKVCDAMTFAHQNGVLHRDLKPGNVLVTEVTGEPAAKVIDFGLAKAVGEDLAETPDLTRAGQVMGTPAYMSPEQAAAIGDPVDVRSDVWALGVMLYELLVGGLPFDLSGIRERGFAELQRVLLHDQPVLPSRRAGSVPDATVARRAADRSRLIARLRGDLDAIVVKALECRPADRFASVSQMADDVRRHLAHEPILAARTSVLDRWRKLVARRGRVVVAATVGALGIVVAPFVIGAMYLRSERALRDFDLVADAFTLAALVHEAEQELFPASPELVGRIDAWQQSLDAIVATAPIYEQITVELEQRRQADGTWTSPRDELLSRQVQELRVELGIVLASGGVAERVADRRDWSEQLVQVTLVDAAERWRQAIADIGDVRASPAYRGLQLAPQQGLIPLGRDAESGLWEFAFPRPGEQLPERGDDGRWSIEDSTCMVFVLIPPGQRQLGVQSDDAERPDFLEGASAAERGAPVAQLEAFFLSRYEMTQGQWLRFTGSNPSTRPPSNELVNGLDHPVETISWEDARRVVSRLGLTLPTSAQWEYAARAGSAGLFWWEGGPLDVPAGAVNCGDVTGQAAGLGGDLTFDTWHDDGWVAHAPVDVGMPNPYGLHDVCGNLWEWCLDRSFRWDEASVRAGDGLSIATNPTNTWSSRAEKRDLRGGSYLSSILKCRCTLRLFQPKDAANEPFGVRPARPVRAALTP